MSVSCQQRTCIPCPSWSIGSRRSAYLGALPVGPCRKIGRPLRTARVISQTIVWLLGVCRDGFLDLCLDGLQVETRAFLHRRILDRGLGHPGDLLLYELEAPEFKGEPVVKRQRTVGAVRKVHAFERIK